MKTMTVRFSEKMISDLEIIAWVTGKPIIQFMREAIDAYLLPPPPERIER